jgi:hypothetical protein
MSITDREKIGETRAEGLSCFNLRDLLLLLVNLLYLLYLKKGVF